MSKEIVTLQFGTYSNFVGSHWWNFQAKQCENRPEVDDELRIDTNSTMQLRKSAAGLRKSIWTPRLISVDFKGSRCHSVIDDDVTVAEKPADTTWQGEIKKYEEAKGSVSNDWSSFLRLQLHPRSVLTLPGSYNNESFELHTSGLDAFRETNISSEIEESLRFFSEECDHCQGFQILCDLHDGFSGLASSTLELIRDDFPKRGIVVAAFPKSHGFSNVDFLSRKRQILSYATALHELASHECLVLPLSLMKRSWEAQPSQFRSFPHISFDAYNPYESSSVFAAGLETFSSCYRSGGINMNYVISCLTSMGRPIASLRLGLPLPARDDVTFRQFLSSYPSFDRDSFVALTPYLDSQSHPFAQCVSVRGISSANQSLNHYLERNYAANLNVSSGHSLGLVTDSSFPLLWPSEYARKGKESEVASMSLLQSSSDAANVLTSLLAESSSHMTLAKVSHHFDQDKIAESHEHLKQLSQNYTQSKPRSASDSSSSSSE
ncbi:protein misato homolog 1-like [Oscarella lobularis]|uniref:protein misato homolog 1-like n=1 Tax=Oscarella lobularis TaxID=121494 RepID=UPI0033130AE8